ncbi:MAG: type II toxin-antitoxin system HicB family antitoxin [Acetatifactor sp.]|nr:type II toxin-antitoxin system HicB family antitoxin [Acetatifactor sp.]
MERLEKQYKRQNEHIKENYDRVSITLPKGTKERIKARGESVNGYIARLVLADLAEQSNAEDMPPFM